MAKLILIDSSKAGLFSFAPTCKTTQAAQAELTARGWTNSDAMKHIDAALAAGAYVTDPEKAAAETRQTVSEEKA